MLYRLGQRSKEENGFTLIELLVVILIIGILAAIAIPSFLNQKSKAYDASAKELARTAETTAESYGTDHGGEFAWSTKGLEELKKYETGLPGCPKPNGACLSEAPEVESGKGFKVVAEAQSTGDKFEILRDKEGNITRKCTSAGTKNGCSGSASGSW